MNLKQYDKKLANHDWFYYYSDDGRVYRAGRESASVIEDMMRQSDDHTKLYVAWSKFVNKEIPIEALTEIRMQLGIVEE